MGFRILALTALALHLAWILWVALGWLVTRRRRVLRWLHIGSLAYAIFIVLGPWPCPLTLLELWAWRRAGVQPGEVTFLERLFDLLVYPDLPFWLITAASVAVCVLNLGIYLRRFRRRRNSAW